MPDLAAALSEAAATLAAAGLDEPRRHARRLVGAALGLAPADIVADPARPLSVDDTRRVAAMTRRRAAGEPLSRILGRREFWGLEFALSADTLDPRPETETLVEAVLRHRPDRAASARFLDLGTGTGCLLLALLSEFPAGQGVGIDIACGAAATARRNAISLGVGSRAVFAVGDWGEAVSGRFDAIVANPPYVTTAALATLPREVADHDPRRALDGGGDGLAAYQRIARDLPRLLAPDGIAAIEIGLGQAESVAGLVAASGLVVAAIEPDLAGIPRCVVARHAS